MTEGQGAPLQGLAEAASGLRKVEDHQKAKNRDPSQKVSTVPATAGSGGGARGMTGGPAVCGEPKGEPKKEIERDNWIVSNYAGAGMIELDEGVLQKQLVFVSNCNNVTIMIKKKVKSILVENCANVCIAVEQPVLSSVDFCNCKKMIFHAMGEVNTCQIDKTDGIQVFAHADSTKIKIMHCLSQNMNINRMNAEEDWVETAIPNAFVAYYNESGKLQTEVSDLYAAWELFWRRKRKAREPKTLISLPTTRWIFPMMKMISKQVG